MIFPLSIAIVSASILSQAANEAPALPERGICAHRGANSTHPENTLAAYREAVRLGAHMIELDVYLTKDQKLVVIHDRTVDRTTDGTGNVADLTLAEIKALDAGSWKGEAFKGARIPTLHEALSVMPRDIWLNVHLKGGADLGEAVARVLAGEDRLAQAFLACNAEAAKAARAAVPGILICNMDRQSGAREYVDLTIEMDADFIQLKGPITDEFPELTKRLKEEGVRINYFGTDSPEELRKLFEVGIEFPLVNDVPPLMKTAEELGIPPVAR